MLSDEIEKAQRLVRTDAYQMSIGEIVSMYDGRELIIDPEFQRLFRWNVSQKSKLIESLLLGIPLPSIFVFEKDNGSWELIDGLQRISTILEYMGKLKEQGRLLPPSVLEATKYLPSLHNTVWEKSPDISDVEVDEQHELDVPQKLAIRRARLSVEILKRPSDTLTKFDLFQRLNAGGTQANSQELRNCIMLMVNADYFRAIRAVADQQRFQRLLGLSEDQLERQRHLEMAIRFLVQVDIPYETNLDVEEYIDEGAVTLAQTGDKDRAVYLLTTTFALLFEAAGEDALRRFEAGRFAGKIGLVALEGIAVGVGKNLAAISNLPSPVEFVRHKIESFWAANQLMTFTSPGLRGTTRIQRTVPFGELWFRP